MMRRRILVLLACSLFLAFCEQTEASQLTLPKFGTDFMGTAEHTVESGVELIREYPHRWLWIEPYEPGSPEIDNLSISPSDCHREIVLDNESVKHYFDWGYPDRRIFPILSAGKEIYFSTHATHTWASTEECINFLLDKMDEDPEIYLRVNCPLKDAEAVKQFKFFIRRYVERFDNDGIDDINLTCICDFYKYNCPGNPQDYNKAVRFWQLGAEYDSYDGYFHGTPEEYLEEFEAFSDAVRAEDPNALIVSNGLATSPAWTKGHLEYNGSFHAGLAFSRLMMLYNTLI
jgi:hypothetical protein